MKPWPPKYKVWKLPKFTLTIFWQNFREIKVVTKEEVTKELISRNIFFGERDYLLFPRYMYMCRAIISRENVFLAPFAFLKFEKSDFTKKSLFFSLHLISHKNVLLFTCTCTQCTQCGKTWNSLSPKFFSVKSVL